VDGVSTDKCNTQIYAVSAGMDWAVVLRQHDWSASTGFYMTVSIHT